MPSTAYQLGGPTVEQEVQRVIAQANRELCTKGHPSLWNIRCELADGELVLHGVVPTYYLLQMAQESVRCIPGVRTVRNLIEVSNAGSATGG